MNARIEQSINVIKRGLSIREIGDSYGLSKGFVTLEIKRGKLRARRLGRRVIVLEEDLRRYLEQS